MSDIATWVNPALHRVLTEPVVAPSALRELTAALARGDDPAWGQFHRDYGPMIFRRLLAATRGDHDLASEALQQTYLRIARHVRPCEVAPMFDAWLRVVAQTALSDCRRRRRTFWELLRNRDAMPEGAHDSAPEALLSLALDQALAQLTAADRGLLEHKYFVGADVRALAAQLEITPKAVESRLTRARTELRRLLLIALKRHE